MEQVEIWKRISNFSYEISSLGRVRRCEIISKYSNSSVGKILKPWKTGNSNYLAVTLIKDGKQYAPTVHKLVMEAFIGERPYKTDIHHMNGDRHDNRLMNLSYVSRSWNMRASNIPKGPKPKLSKRDIDTIKFLSIRDGKSGGITGRRLAKRFNCSEGTISKVINDIY